MGGYKVQGIFMKCENCGKSTDELFLEPVAPGEDATKGRSVCEDCRDKAQSKVADAQKADAKKSAEAQAEERRQNVKQK